MKRNMLFGTTTNDQKWMIDSTNQLIKEGKLFRCLNCRSLNVADENSNKTAELFKRFEKSNFRNNSGYVRFILNYFETGFLTV